MSARATLFTTPITTTFSNQDDAGASVCACYGRPPLGLPHLPKPSAANSAALLTTALVRPLSAPLFRGARAVFLPAFVSPACVRLEREGLGFFEALLATNQIFDALSAPPSPPSLPTTSPFWARRLDHTHKHAGGCGPLLPFAKRRQRTTIEVKPKWCWGFLLSFSLLGACAQGVREIAPCR